MDDGQRLAAYDAFATDVRLELERTAGRMDELRDIDRRLAERGL